MALLSPETTVKELFLKACEENDLHKVQFFFSLGADVNWREDDGCSGLHWAASRNYGELLGLLLGKTGVDVNIRDIMGVTPLMVACASGHENIVRTLTQVPDIQLNCRDEDGRTALLWAVSGNNPDCVSVLRSTAGVEWNARSDDGFTPLTEAVFWGLAEILQIILSVPEPPLDFSVTDVEGRNIAQHAVERIFGDRQRCVELLSGDRRIDPYWNVKNTNGDAPVMFSLKNNRTVMATTLLSNTSLDLDLDTLDSQGRHLEDIAKSVHI